MRHIPNLITSLNLVSGFAGIILAAKGDIVSASWLIAAAMIFDFLDGFSARLLKAYSDIGKELDSLADVVSFGVAPAVIIFHFLSSTVSPDAMILISEDPGKFMLMLLPAVMPVCAALRLAVFNLDPSQSVTFRGLPTPANALAVITMVFAVNFSESEFLQAIVNSPAWLIAYTFVLSFLMVSRIPLFSLKINDFGWKGNEGRYLLVIFMLIALLLLGMTALLLVIPLYILASVVQFYIIEN
jgi:CDP-diacylglycerol---serine O-phosphatidyltransferase